MLMRKMKHYKCHAYSKLFDQHVRRVMPNAHSQIVGLRYFNVYGPHEEHKKSMASVIYHFYNQITNHGEFFYSVKTRV